MVPGILFFPHLVEADVGVESHDEDGEQDVEFGVGSGVVEEDGRHAVFGESRVDENVADLILGLAGHPQSRHRQRLGVAKTELALLTA